MNRPELLAKVNQLLGKDYSRRSLLKTIEDLAEALETSRKANDALKKVINVLPNDSSKAKYMDLDDE